ncbi:HAD family hydrolase [Pseudomonas oryzihabitans]|uniref:HAD family hydrolase n=2 Tax=Pseudomonas TaxID=286 RepID=UPI0005CA5EB5|nr:MULTISPECIES: HAD family hydrolase [Pseudomonas]KIZ50929.1 HAD family hydrolase [Pseudomonas oryzihabitans]MBA1259695.1 HAD family hydrolase [Pseudomonas psychrotolerans]MBH3330277.1 HAD family hydrolase [Pseudomonas oryzihabitans]
MTLRHLSHWVFDLDGTLTLAVHDFAAIRRHLGIPEQADILHHLAELPATEREAKHAWLFEHERELAVAARPAPGAVALIRRLHEDGRALGILTRNARDLALLTLAAIGLEDCFAPAAVLGRDEAPPKPDPGGLLRLAELWQVAPDSLVMIGDHRYDLECGRAVGCRTLQVNQPGDPWPAARDQRFETCTEILAAL